MIASLPMYDRPETRAANNRFWARIHAHLLRLGIPSPARMQRSADVRAQWLAADLVLSQTCGLPFRQDLHDKVTLVGTPISNLDCPAGQYYSVLIARKDDARSDFQDFDGATLAYNAPDSQSGWAAVQQHANRAGVRFAGLLETGAHQASAQAVATGAADIAAIDANTWALIRQFDPWAVGLKPVGQTDPTPALPYITAPGIPEKTLYEAIATAIDDLSPADRGLLSLSGLCLIPVETYRALPLPTPPS